MSVAAVEGVRYWYDTTAGAFLAPGRAQLPVVLPPPPVDSGDLTRARDNLIPGVDKPGPTNTGPYSITTWTDVFPPAGSNEITVSASPPPGRRYWGAVKVPAGSSGIVFREAWFVGPDPLTYGPGMSTQNKGCIQNFGGNPGTFEVWDSVLDPMPWVTEQGRASLNPNSFGVHGGNVKMYRTEIVNCGDGWNFLGPNGTNAAAVLAQSTLLQQSWLHKGYYANDQRHVPDGQIHCDGFQTNYGRNVRIFGNTIGGVVNHIGYNTWPGWAPSNGPGYNAGDDFAYSALMLTQEAIPNGDTNNLLTNIVIESNWLGGGSVTINIPVERGTDHSGTTIRNNRFLRRQTNWATKLKAQANAAADGPGGWVPFQKFVGVGDYCTNNGDLATKTNNVFEDNGALVPRLN